MVVFFVLIVFTTSDAVNPVDKATLLGQIPCQWPRSPGYCHSFGMTENYIVLLEQPAYIDFMACAMSRIKGRTLRDTIKFSPEYQVHVWITRS